MKKINFQPRFLQILYLIIFSIIFFFVIYIPILVKGPVQLTEKMILKEEAIEGSLLCILFIMSILILNLYKHEIDKHKELINKISTEKMKVEDRLFNSEQYIGITNIQIQEIKYIFNSIDKFPETKDDLKRACNFFGERVIGIVNSNWVLFRIIDSNTQRTLCEHFVTRQEFSCSYPHVSNKMVIEKQPILPFIYVNSNPKNLNILISCIMPIDKISNDQHIFVQAIINEIAKLFVILNALYYKKRNKIFIEDFPDKK
ncbi:MAG: hypothetical protein NT092_01035 [Bacteroidia bacterium]|nr:hypothetical protein [Bacteroidia bacterium]